jgi:hypothetical protein
VAFSWHAEEKQLMEATTKSEVFEPIDKVKLAEIADTLLKRMWELEHHPKNRPTEHARRNFFHAPYVKTTGRPTP